MADLSDALDAQIAALEAALLADGTLPPQVHAYLHLQAAKRLMLGGDVGKLPDTAKSLFSPSRGTGKVRRQVDPNRLRVLERAANVIRGRSYPTKTAEIFGALEPEMRSLIGGTDQKGNLSAMLHHAPAFISHGRAGWTLNEENQSGVPSAEDPTIEETPQPTIFGAIREESNHS